MNRTPIPPRRVWGPGDGSPSLIPPCTSVRGGTRKPNLFLNAEDRVTKSGSIRAPGQPRVNGRIALPYTSLPLARRGTARANAVSEMRWWGEQPGERSVCARRRRPVPPSPTGKALTVAELGAASQSLAGATAPPAAPLSSAEASDRAAPPQRGALLPETRQPQRSPPAQAGDDLPSWPPSSEPSSEPCSPPKTPPQSEPSRPLV